MPIPSRAAPAVRNIRMNKRHWSVFFLLLLGLCVLVLALLPEPGAVIERTLVGVAFAAVAVVYVLHRRTETQLTEQLGESEKFIRTLVDGIADPVMIIDEDFRVTTANKAARDSLCMDRDAGGPVHCYRAMHGLEEPCDPSQRPCALLTGESSKEIQVVADEDGRQRVVEIRSTPLHDDNGKLTGVVEVTHDLNEQEKVALKLKRAQEDVETANRARSEFVATMSHEVRTPMNAVLGMTDLLRLTDLKRKQKTYVQIIESSGNMLLSLVDNVLDFSALESGNLVLREQEISVSDLLEQVLAIMGYQAYSKGLEFIGHIQDNSNQRISADAQRLRQIMINLISNAIKFTDQGEIVVQVGIDAQVPERALLLVEVSDSGIGMSEQTKSTLFEPFVGATDTNSDAYEQGSGLGLTISKQLIDLMGGEIGIESELGEGTRARFSVPVATIPVAEADTTHREKTFKTRRMLIVNANDRISQIICQNLENWGMQCEPARFPNEVSELLAVAKAEGLPFDGAIIDFDLPDANGLALARAIRADSNLAYLPIILLTSIARPLEVGEVSPIGGIRCVNKPILPSELRHNLFSVLEVDDWQGKNAVEDDVRALRILIAEDNPLNRKLLSRMLESLGHGVDCADDGPAALRAAEEKSYDLILMDCQMPGFDGDEVTRRIRENADQQKRQPIIVAVTADISPEHKSKCLQAGMDDFLAKPIRLQVLKSGLRRWSSLINGGSSEAGVAEQASGIVDDQDIVRQLRDRAGNGGVNFVNEYIDLFLQDTASRLDIMRAAVEHEDQVTLGRECHALKGACLEVGVSDLGAYCDALRDASRDRRFDEIPEALLRLSEEFSRIKPVFEAEKNRPF